MRRVMMRTWGLLAAALLAPALAWGQDIGPEPEPKPAPLEGSWEGFVTFDGKRQVVVRLLLYRGKEDLLGTVDLPEQRRHGVPINYLQYDEGRVQFVLEGRVPVVFQGQRRGQLIQGQVRQGDATGRFVLQRSPEAAPEPMAALVAKLGELPGVASLCALKLGPEPAEVAAIQTDTVCAVASAIKLAHFGAIAEAVNAGERQWTDILRVSEAQKSLPAGILGRWPEGTPMTLQSLALLAATYSDNSAADHLFAAFGREALEAQLATMGISAHPGNAPFLSTAELFRLKSEGQEALSRRYLTADAAARRAILAELAEAEAPGLKLRREPTHTASIEWFASPRELCLAWDWLRKATEGTPAAPLRELLGVNIGLELDTRPWKTVCYKGGSEPGVLCLSFLMEREDGAWFALAAAWNHEARLDEARFTDLVRRIINALAREG